MKEQFQQIIDMMRKHVLENLELIKNNEGQIREVLNLPQTAERNQKLNDSYKYSKVLLAENNDYINLQVAIMNFVNKYQSKFESSPAVKVNEPVSVSYQKNLSREDMFRLTVENDLSYDSSHPYFHDEEFFQELLQYYEQTENYEMCAALLKLKK